MPAPIDKYCVSLSKTLFDAMRAIDKGGAGIAMVLDEDGRLVGTMTDGDIRRALLRGTSLERPLAPCVRRKFTAVGPAAGRAEVLDLMQARLLNQVPIVDGEGRLLGLHLLHELIGAIERPNWAVIMAGGEGRRLRPITEDTPKPMVRVAGRPILERLVLHLVSFGIRRIFLAVNYMGKVIEDHFGDGARLGCRIEYLREEEPLGTGGPLALLPPTAPDPLLVLNGDLVTQVNLDKMFAAHAAGGFLATLGIRRYSHRVPFGSVEVTEGLVSRIEEKPVLTRSINGGIYVLGVDLVQRVPKRFTLITDLFEEALAKGERIGAYEIEEDWIDVGQHEQLQHARQGGS